jgi:archaemetzincin
LTESKIYIVPIELKDISIINPLLSVLPLTFKLPVEVYRKQIILDIAYDKRRNQYYSTALLSQIIEKPPADASHLLGVTDLDLFIPVLTYLYGEAQFNGLGALMSTFRLRNEFYRKSPDKILLEIRLIKEAIHELGHTYGLPHCNHPDCVMRSSTYIEDVDEKTSYFCKSCQEILNTSK